MSDKGLHIDISAQIGALELFVTEHWQGGWVTALFGPSGSGKTSLLRLIAGYKRPKTGRIAFGENVWSDQDKGVFIPPHKRPIGFVHQSAPLLPMRVSKNLSYAETRSIKRSTRLPPDEWDKTALIDKFELSHLLEHTPDMLSGGERQRVALAQTILSQPDLLLLDEPLSALDAKRKAQTLSILAELNAAHTLPMIYVSHDMAELARIADTVSVIADGQIIATGETALTLNAHGFARTGSARSGTVLCAHITEHDAGMGLMNASVGPHMLKLPRDAAYTSGHQLRLIIQASDVVLSTQAPKGLSVQNSMNGQIVEIEPEGETPLAHVTLNLDGTDETLVAQITKAAVAELGLELGQDIYALIKTAVLAR